MLKRPVLAGLFLILLLAMGAPAPAQDEAPQGGVVLVDIEETVDLTELLSSGEQVVAGPNMHTYLIQGMLKDAGFKVLTLRPTQWSKDDPVDLGLAEDASKEERQQAVAAKIAELQPDFIIRGRAVARFLRASIMMDVPAGFIYGSTTELELLDGSGEVLTRVTIEDEWGAKPPSDALESEEKKLAAGQKVAQKALQRMGSFAMADLYGVAELYQRTLEAKRPRIDGFVKKMQAQRNK